MGLDIQKLLICCEAPCSTFACPPAAYHLLANVQLSQSAHIAVATPCVQSAAHATGSPIEWLRCQRMQLPPQGSVCGARSLFGICRWLTGACSSTSTCASFRLLWLSHADSAFYQMLSTATFLLSKHMYICTACPALRTLSTKSHAARSQGGQAS